MRDGAEGKNRKPQEESGEAGHGDGQSLTPRQFAQGFLDAREESVPDGGPAEGDGGGQQRQSNLD